MVMSGQSPWDQNQLRRWCHDLRGVMYTIEQVAAFLDGKIQADPEYVSLMKETLMKDQKILEHQYDVLKQLQSK